METSLPKYGSAPAIKITAKLVQGTAQGEHFTVGKADARSDCRGGLFVAPNGGERISRAVVRIKYEVHVKRIQGRLTDDQSRLVLHDLIVFDRNQEQGLWA